jgi:hypothetical protein
MTQAARSDAERPLVRRITLGNDYTTTAAHEVRRGGRAASRFRRIFEGYD